MTLPVVESTIAMCPLRARFQPHRGLQAVTREGMPRRHIGAVSVVTTACEPRPLLFFGLGIRNTEAEGFAARIRVPARFDGGGNMFAQDREKCIGLGRFLLAEERIRKIQDQLARAQRLSPDRDGHPLQPVVLVVHPAVPQLPSIFFAIDADRLVLFRLLHENLILLASPSEEPAFASRYTSFMRFLLAVALLLLAIPAFADGRTECAAMKSAALAHPVRYCAALPPSYDDKSRRFPFVYFLHGLGENSQTLIGGIGALIADLQSAGKIKEFLVITPDAGTSFYINSHDGRLRYEDFFIREFIQIGRAHV